MEVTFLRDTIKLGDTIPSRYQISSISLQFQARRTQLLLHSVRLGIATGNSPD